MKYLTPDRLIRLQERVDETLFAAALDEWENALSAYRKCLDLIRPEAPAGVQQLMDLACLHDARVLDMWWSGRTQFTVTLHPESEPSRLVVLTYSLLTAPDVKDDVLPESVRTQPVAWLYDELDSAKSIQSRPAFLHRILLSDGREITLTFRNILLKRPLSFFRSTFPAN